LNAGKSRGKSWGVAVCLLWGAWSGGVSSVARADEIVFTQSQQKYELQGEILVEADDGGVLFRDSAGKLWLVQANELQSRKVDEKTRGYLSAKELAAQVLTELPNGFRTEISDHFIVAYNTERAYAKYISGLYERLLRGYTNYWKSKHKWKLSEPAQPLVVILFSDQEEYAAFVRRDLGTEPPGVAYYGILTNRVVMYDLTSSLAPSGFSAQDDRQISEILSAPGALAMIMTIVHEGTHQLMFNTGMQRRLAATPLWLNEGLAMFFETPDLSANSGWRAIGQINPVRLVAFRAWLNSGQRPPQSLAEMVGNDAVFQAPDQLLNRYAEAWSFNFFLLNKHSKAYVQYLKFISEKEPLWEDDAATRIEDFERFFPQGLAEMEREFLEYIRRLQ
jgi:hypothetical protein